MLTFRIADHRGYVLNKRTDKSNGEYFNLPGHNLADLRITIIDPVSTGKNKNITSLEDLTPCIED